MNEQIGINVGQGSLHKEQWERLNLYCPKCGHHGLWERYGDHICAKCNTLYQNDNGFEAFDIETEHDIKIYEAVKKFEEKEDNAPKELEDKRTIVADSLFEKATPEELDLPEDGVVIESDGWEHDGDNRLIKKFYYSDNEYNNEDSKVASFIVEFEPDTAVAIDSHSNTH